MNNLSDLTKFSIEKLHPIFIQNNIAADESVSLIVERK
jgi:hypothetical protein